VFFLSQIHTNLGDIIMSYLSKIRRASKRLQSFLESKLPSQIDVTLLTMQGTLLDIQKIIGDPAVQVNIQKVIEKMQVVLSQVDKTKIVEEVSNVAKRS
jgi:hypothetical protein